MVSIRSLISNFFSPITKPLWTIPNAPINIGMTVTLVFHSFIIIINIIVVEVK